MNKTFMSMLILCLAQPAFAKEEIKALYVPLADHYPAIVAYEKYRSEMKEADFVIEQKKTWPALRGQFESGKTDMALIISPMAMDMFAQKPDFRWVSLIHRNGNALAVNQHMQEYLNLEAHRKDRKPSQEVADAFGKAKQALGEPSLVGVPSELATHVVILYKFLKEHGKTLGIKQGQDKDVIAVPVAPPVSPSFLKTQDEKGRPAAFEQSLPWADIVETHDYGKVAWYSKDVLEWPHGHVECIVIARDESIENKTAALKEVVYYLHKAGQDIQQAQAAGGDELKKIAALIRKHIPAHEEEAILQSLSKELDVINYVNLNIDKGGLKQVMDLAVEGGILKQAIDIDKFADEQFSTEFSVE
jgi:NitT/TauT family transport system substrate-binding protein